MVPCNHTLTRGPPRPGGDCLERLGPDDQKELPRTKNCGSGRHGQAQGRSTFAVFEPSARLGSFVRR